VGRKRKLKMIVRVVPAGTLEPNPGNPHFREKPDERQKAITRLLAQALAKIVTTKEPVTTDAGAPAPSDGVPATV
jgi:hypothetical protein